MAVIGTGLIGTSVALAASRQGVTVFLSDRDPSAARTAAGLGAGLARTPRERVDLAVLAVPPSKVGSVLVDAQRRRLAHSYTDVASVKAGPERVALARAPAPSRYIGGHPLAGRELSGPLAARAELFEGRPWVLTPSPLTSGVAWRHARELAELCGAVPLVMRSRDHDETVALTSHVPHLMASLTAARLRQIPGGAGRLAGQGLRDVTRIAAGDSGLWTDILQSNAAAMTGVVRELQADLARVATALAVLADPDADGRPAGLRTMTDLLDRGIAGLAAIPGAAAGTAGGADRVRVAVADRPGELPRLLDALAGLGIDAVLGVDADAGSGPLVRFAVPEGDGDSAAAKLRADGWDAEPAGNAGD
ncbi:prephenate dehydrogenase/arogenate dehydrogenase family protein [Streptomyces sp. A7024]|uniref:Prephenate dehydrogenase/arogenate dehydrogenase family protein n=1 Tax=Streptomyces coryli TaxID=1128680 RepID=A0A6G4U258_9ACTN|nr:prephenate dehydrogenase [Streptomyces coryli]NGN66173.1 prephenate dehydrogenase/arogenate dehydrogenase family protein [Streptomyces coryli]